MIWGMLCENSSFTSVSDLHIFTLGSFFGGSTKSNSGLLQHFVERTNVLTLSIF